MNIYFVIIIGSLLAGLILNTLANLLGARHLSPRLPDRFRDAIDQGSYAKSQEYARAGMRLETVQDICSTAIILAVILGGGFEIADQFARSFATTPVITGLLFFAILGFAADLLSLPFAIYSTFVLEARFGFNTTTVKTFILDKLKGLLLSVIIGGPLLAAVLWFFHATGPAAWLWCWLVVTIVTLFLSYLAPVVILPLFNKFTPLEAGELRTAIETLAKQAGFALTGLFVMDGSKRSTKGNAFFTGLGNKKRIALFDTLVENQSTDEIAGVLAHEIGHSKLGHIKKTLAVSILKTGAVFWLMSLFLESRGLFDAFGVAQLSPHAGLVFFGLLYTPISLILSIISSAVSRKHEFEADAFAAQLTGRPEDLASALVKLSAKNLSNLTPHPLMVWLHYSHPPVLERLKRLDKKT